MGSINGYCEKKGKKFRVSQMKNKKRKYFYFDTEIEARKFIILAEMKRLNKLYEAL